MANKVNTTKPILVMLYGFPGAGKTHFARLLHETINSSYVSADRIRGELFEQPRYNSRENTVITHLMDYMTEEFLASGVNVIYDVNAMRLGQRRKLRDLARRTRAQAMLIWVQIDVESAFTRLSKRDRRKTEDRLAVPYDRSSFEDEIKAMQNPHDEDYIVISGKHHFNTQRSAVIKRLYDLGLISADSATLNVVKPGMVNLVPKPLSGRVDISRRNIVIR